MSRPQKSFEATPSISRGGNEPASTTNPLIVLPPRVPKQPVRPAQSNIPDSKTIRSGLVRLCARYVDRVGLVPPIPLSDLRSHAEAIAAEAGVNPAFVDYIAVLVNNAAWRDTLAGIPYERRLLLLPKCLRVEEHCPAPFDEFGLLCKECGLCSLHDLTVEADRLGYAVLVAEGSAIVRQMIETGRVDAIVGVSCLNVLEKCFPHLEATAVPGISIPLLQDDCMNTTVDLDQVWEMIHLTSDDRTYRLDLDGVKADVESWFQPAALDEVMGPVADESERIGRDWLLRAGKRWRPYLTACVYLALRSNERDASALLTADVKKLAVAVECFHKASLIHDDIEDGDDVRYGERTVHAEHGLPVALNVGDFLLGEGYRLIGEVDAPAETQLAMLRGAASGHVTLCRGQGAELCWSRRRRPLTSLEVLAIFRQKTVPAFEVALRLGALLGGADENLLAILGKYSESLGIAYQIRDDLDDHTGESDSHDLRDLRPSLLLAIAQKRADEGAEHDLMTAVWSGETNWDECRAEVRRIFSERGVTQKAQDLLDAYKEQAVRSLRPLTSPTLKGLLRRVIGKIYGENLIEGYCGEFEARNAAGRETRSESAS